MDSTLITTPCRLPWINTSPKVCSLRQGIRGKGRSTTETDYAQIDRSVNYGRFDDLREQEFQLYGNYSLPFGRNKQFLSNVPKWSDLLISGYNLSPSLNWSSGLPFSPSYGECGSDIPSGPCQPNKAVGTMPTNLTSFNTTSHRRTYFTPLPCSLMARLPDRSPGPTSIYSAMLDATTTRAHRSSIPTCP